MVNDADLLHGVYLRLTREGMPLGVRDYLDALTALRAGYGLFDRAALLWLCQTLWARSEEDERRIALLFDRIPPVGQEAVRAVERRYLGDAEPQPEPPIRDPLPASTDVEGARPAAGGRRSSGRRDAGGAASAQVHFEPAGQSGLLLPRATCSSATEEPFVLHPRPAIALRSFVNAWRRLRTPRRSGARTVLDVPGTIDDMSRTGCLVRPRMVAPRRNWARLTVFVDVSVSMTPWEWLPGTLEESLRQGRLDGAEVFYFNNLPDQTLYRTADLTNPEPMENLAEVHGGTPLLIVGDGGAARGRRNPERRTETKSFLKAVAEDWLQVAWLNPMPQARWRGTSFDAVTSYPGVAAFALSAENLARVADVLRAQREE